MLHRPYAQPAQHRLDKSNTGSGGGEDNRCATRGVPLEKRVPAIFLEPWSAGHVFRPARRKDDRMAGAVKAA
ncbi:MAG: hypothetical protein ACK5NY_08500 [Burkholderiaceae bacterium]